MNSICASQGPASCQSNTSMQGAQRPMSPQEQARKWMEEMYKANAGINGDNGDASASSCGGGGCGGADSLSGTDDSSSMAMSPEEKKKHEEMARRQAISLQMAQSLGNNAGFAAASGGLARAM